VAIANLPRFHGGMVGYLSYEVARYFERLPCPDKDPQGLPESVLMLAGTLLVFDHVTHKIKVVSHAHLDGDVDTAYREATCKIDDLVNRLEQPMHSEALKNAPPDRSAVSSNFSAAEFEAIVSKAKEYIYAGDIIQAVLSQRLARRTAANPFAIYRALRSINPSPYMYYLHLGDFYIAGASPELLVRVEDGIVSPILLPALAVGVRMPPKIWLWKRNLRMMRRSVLSISCSLTWGAMTSGELASQAQSK
jgi:anthranilate synthase component 1